MIKKGEKRSLSTIIATLIIILLVLVAVGILWVVIRNVIKSGSEEISLGKLTVSLKIEKAQILNEENISVTVKREAGKGEISGLLFVIEDEGNSETVTKDLSLSEFELRTFILTLENMNTENVKTIKVVPLFKLESGKEIIGDVKDEYVISTSSEEESPYIPPAPTFIVRSIIAGSDDAEERLDTNAVNIGSTDLEITYDTANQHVGMRFQFVNIPRGATIQSAVLEFTCDESSSGAGSVTIFGQAIDNAPTFSTSTGNISSRALTSNSVSWTFSEAWVAGTKYNSSDLKNVIQEVVNRGGWNANNNLVIIITSDLTAKSNSRTAEAYEGTDVARLYIEY